MLARLTAPEAARLARDPKALVFLPLGAGAGTDRATPGPGGAGYFGWPAAARAKTGREAMALRGRLIAERLVRALGNRPRS